MEYQSSFRSLCFFVCAFFAVTLMGCTQQNAQKGQKGGGNFSGRGGNQRVANVQTSALKRISIQRSVDLSGTLISPDQARVSSEVAGVVRDVLVEIGHEVKEGQELVRLDTTELKLAMDRAESALRQTEAQLGVDASRGGEIPPDEQIATVRTAAATRDSDRAQLARAMELSGKGLASKVELDAAQTKAKVSDAAYQAALENVHALKASVQDRRASYELAKKKLNDATIRTQIAGAVAERSVQRGEYIRENTPVVTIVRMDPLKLRTAVQEKYANLIHQNQVVDFGVEPFPNDKFHGKIAFISPSVDQSTRTFAVEVLVNNPAHKLKPGFFAKGEILVGVDENVLAVPDETVSVLAGVSSVFVIENGIIKQTSIQLGEHEGKFFEVLSGLKGDEILAASNLNELVTGVKVGSPSDEDGSPAGDPGSESGKRRGGRGGDKGGRGSEEKRGTAQ
jgi:RND family efflux transporter MFP subunit